MTKLPPHATALVTGATGFIGRRLVRRLIEDECRVACLVRATSSIDPLQAWGAHLLTSDLDDSDAVHRLIASVQPTVVFHAAGLVRASRTRQFMQVNGRGTETIAAACARCTSPPVLVMLSSLAAAGPSPPDQPRTETHVPEPISVYGRSKLSGERRARKYADAVPITIVRPPIVFGPEDRGVLQMMRPIERWRAHVVPRDGSFHLSLVHVDDLVQGLIRAALRGDRVQAAGPVDHGIYFMAACEQPTYRELGHMIARALGRPHPRVVRIPAGALTWVGRLGDAISQWRGRPGWINSDKIGESLAGSWTCCSSRATSQLSWEPAASLEQRLDDTVQWYREAGWL